jgi:hypothetical protein
MANFLKNRLNVNFRPPDFFFSAISLVMFRFLQPSEKSVGNHLKSQSIGDSQLCRLRFDLVEADTTMCILDGDDP